MDGTVLVPLKENNFIGSTLADRYLIQSLIGQGGMGLVFLAKHTMMERTVAIKMLHQELLNDPLSVKRFQQEAKAASCLNHPNIITLHDFGITPQGQPFLCMEYLQGTPLQDLLKRYGPMDPPRAVRIFGQVCDALHHAHNQGIVHRDLKPSNILLVTHEGDPEFVKVVDFGLAKLMPWSGKESQHLTKTGEVFGSPIYMSPEQCMGKQLDPRSDIYSLGVTLFEALTGKPPFRGQNSIQTASKHMSELPPTFGAVRPDLTLPPGLEAVVFRSLEKDPAKRYTTMAEMKEAMERALGADHPIEEPESLTSSRAGVRAVTSPIARATAETTVQKAKPTVNADAGNRYKGYQIAIAFGVVALLGAGAGMAWMNSQKAPASAPIDTQGTIYYLENNPQHRLHLHTNKGDLLKLTFTQLPSEASLNTDREQCNGTVVQLTYDPPAESDELGMITELKVQDGPQTPEKSVSNVVRTFFLALANNEPDALAMTDSINIDKKMFNKDNFQPSWLNQQTFSTSDEKDLSTKLTNPKEKPPSSTFKLASIDDKEAVIYADNALILKTTEPAYWKIELKNLKDQWKISALEPATAADWEKY